MWNKIKTFGYSVWDSVKAFFNYSETKAFNWFMAVSAAIAAVLAGIDWTPLLNLAAEAEFTWKSILTTSGIVGLQSLFTVWLRNRGTRTTEAGRLLPEGEKLEPLAESTKKKLKAEKK